MLKGLRTTSELSVGEEDLSAVLLYHFKLSDLNF